MNTLFQAAALFLLASTALAAEAPPAIYDPDPQHLANRLYAAIAIRTEGGERFGIDSTTAFWQPFDDSALVATLADELAVRKELVSSLSEVKRALLLHDVWTAFDTAAFRNDSKALRPLARAVRALAMDDASIARLPDNYAVAVRSGAFGSDFDPEHPEKAFLPADLFDPEGPWIQIGEMGMGPIASMHVSAVAARSAFMVFVRVPGGREAALGYLNTLNLYRTPFTLSPDPIGTAFDPRGDHPVRMGVVQLNRQTPQFPPGTIFALVRQMALVTDKLQPVMTRITQSIRFRIYVTNDVDWSLSHRDSFARSQRPFEITLTRRDLLGRRAGGLHQVADDETSQDLGIILNGPPATTLRGPVVMSTCGQCHAGAGILSVKTYTSRFDESGRGALNQNPNLMPADDPDYQRRATVEKKQQRYEWGLLQGILTQP